MPDFPDRGDSGSPLNLSQDDVEDQLDSLRCLNEQLTRSESRTRAIIDGIAEGVAVASRDGRLEIFNRAASEILGARLVKAVHDEWASLYGLYLPDGETPCPTEQLPLVRAINGERSTNNPLVVRHPNASQPIHLSVTASPVYDENGEVDGGVAIFQDVTERLHNERLLQEAQEELKKHVQELKASEARYLDLYENAPDMYFTIDAESGEIIECNQTFADALGYTKTNIVGHDLRRFHDPSCLEAVEQSFAHFRETGVFPPSEFVVVGQAGQRIDVSGKVTTVYNDQGQIVRGRCVWRDITRWKQTEEALAVHRTEVAHLMRVHTAGEMATGLAHELNQPLNAIVNYTRGFLRKTQVGVPVTEDLHAVAQELISEAERASNIIAGLRRLVSKCSVEHKACDIAQIMRDSILLCRGELRGNAVAIESHLAIDLPPVLVDEVQMKQVIMSLILNAIEALVEDRVTHPRIMVRSERISDDQVRIDVHDNACGIRCDEPDRVFEAFFTTKKSGMGLGLAICRSIVENHGGKIWNESFPLGGTKFCIAIPLNQ